MPTVVVPFRGAEGKRRLTGLPLQLRRELGEAMLGDVVDACLALGPVYVVTRGQPRAQGATVVADPGGGQGAAVGAGLDAAIAEGAPPPYLVVNADLPCLAPRDVLALAGAIPDGGLALAVAADGTTNALALSSAALFTPLYGPGSAARFAAVAPSRVVDVPNLVDDVDVAEDIERLFERLGPHTRAALERARWEAA
jgi:2-phospho-L-lactate guanylyltransferase